MKRIILRFAVALTMFAVGTTASSLASFKTPPKWEQCISEPDTFESPAKQSATLNSQVYAADEADLSILAKVNWDLPAFGARPIKLSTSGRTIINLDLDEDLAGAEVTLVATDNDVRYRIFQRYRTSMTIMEEGPHLDLVNWRHFDSTWESLQQIEAHRFRMLGTDQMDGSKFPFTTRSEMIKAVRKQVGNNWPDMLERVRACRGPNDGSCAISISSIYLQIQKQVNGSWTNTASVEFRVPMGC